MLAEAVTAVALSLSTGGGAAAPIQVELPNQGYKIGYLTIPKLGLKSWPIRQGTRSSELDRGIGHLRSTFLPGMRGTIGFFGHRVTHVLSLQHGPFRYINRLKLGNRIIVVMPYGRYVYRVRRKFIVTSKSWNTFRPQTESEKLLLAACHKPGSAQFRLVVEAIREEA